MITAKVALPPECEAPRQTRAGVERGTTNYVSSNTAVDSLTQHRAQRLARVFGLTNSHARVIADLVWGGACG